MPAESALVDPAPTDTKLVVVTGIVVTDVAVAALGSVVTAALGMVVKTSVAVGDVVDDTSLGVVMVFLSGPKALEE
jgi:hypothetical protein